MKDDYEASDLNGDPEADLPSFEEVKRIFGRMYESFNDTSSTNKTKPSEDEALLFINGRMSANSWSSTAREVDVCKQMFLADDTNLSIVDESAMNLTLEDMQAVGQACYHTSVSVRILVLCIFVLHCICLNVY